LALSSLAIKEIDGTDEKRFESCVRTLVDQVKFAVSVIADFIVCVCAHQGIHTHKALTHHCNLLNTESAKTYLAKAESSINRKQKICEDLDRFYKYKNIQWKVVYTIHST